MAKNTKWSHLKVTASVLFALGPLLTGCGSKGGSLVPTQTPPAPFGYSFQKNDDPEMSKAVQQAKDSLPEFEAAFRARKPDEKFAVKAIMHGNNGSEYKWINVTTLQENKMVGRLEKDSVVMPSVKAGMTVSVAKNDIEDWAYIDSKHDQHGGFTQAVLQKREGK